MSKIENWSNNAVKKIQKIIAARGISDCFNDLGIASLEE